MLNRDQSYFLLMATLLMVVIIFIPVGSVLGSEFKINLYLKDLQGLRGYAIVLAVANFISVFLYKKPNAQALLGWASVLATVVFQFMLIRQVDTYVNTIREVSVRGNFTWGTLFPLLAIAMILGGLRKIHGDSAEEGQTILPDEGGM